MRGSVSRRRTMSRNVPVAYAMFSAMLCRLSVWRRGVLVVLLGDDEGTSKKDHGGEAKKSENSLSARARPKRMKVRHIFSPIK